MSESIQLTAILTISGSLGKKTLNKRVGEAKLIEWSKRAVNDMRLFLVYETGDIREERAKITKRE